ncbi:MAG: hypothetical protein GY797_35345 [Deltaproteobacteria bacterium]|nr:hypothetical protein [Deltaproteobacteria bacterium]
MIAIQNFQQRLFKHYQNTLSLPLTYNYIHNNPAQTIVPVDTAQNGICIIAPSPPARLATVGTEQDVPIADYHPPFSSTAYFDGSRVRNAASEMTLIENILTSLDLRREQCWLTYLVRVFLFNDEHLVKYRRLGCSWPESETRSQFDALARQGLDWLIEELVLARPRLVITLGAEVAGVLQDVRGREASAALVGEQLQDLWLGESVYPVIHLTEPELISEQAQDPKAWLAQLLKKLERV